MCKHHGARTTREKRPRGLPVLWSRRLDDTYLLSMPILVFCIIFFNWKKTPLGRVKINWVFNASLGECESVHSLCPGRTNMIPWPCAVEGTGEDRVLDLDREKRHHGRQEGSLAGEKKSRGREGGWHRNVPLPKAISRGFWDMSLSFWVGEVGLFLAEDQVKMERCWVWGSWRVWS